MSITCLICNKIFSKQITNSHLKTHNTSTNDYKLRFGRESLSSMEYKKELSDTRSNENNPNYGKKWSSDQKTNMSSIKQGSIPWNKGLTYEASPAQLESIKRREEKYISGELERKTVVMDDKIKEKISKKIKDYANTHKEELSHRAAKATETKRNNGHDFGSAMRGKKHTKEAKKKISDQTIINNKKKTELSILNRYAKFAECNLECLSDPKKNMLRLKCKKCNTLFTRSKQAFTDSKYVSTICPTCHPKVIPKRSKGEIDLFEFIKTLCPDAQSSVRHLFGDKREIDIYIPSHKIGIEYNGLYWHSEEVLLYLGKSKTADLEKKRALNALGIRYIGIFEDEWENKQDIVKSRLMHILNKATDKVFARKCTIKELDSKSASSFCNEHHIQGAGKSNYRLGLIYNNQLVSVMTFSKNNISRKGKNWEINRFCSSMHVVGGASKLFQHFIREKKPSKVISYADSRWSDGDLYNNLNFVKEKDTVANYWYFAKGTNKRIHRFALRKQKTDDQNQTEKELRISEGYSIIWDCGSSKWVWEDEGLKPLIISTNQ